MHNACYNIIIDKKCVQYYIVIILKLEFLATSITHTSMETENKIHHK